MPKYDRQLHALLKERNKLQAMTNTPRQAPAPTPPKVDVEKEVIGLRGIAMNKGLSRTINDTKVAPLPEYKPGVGPLVNKLKMKALQPLANAQQGLRAIAQMPQRILSGKPAPTASSFIGPKLNPSIPTKAPTPTAVPTPTPVPAQNNYVVEDIPYDQWIAKYGEAWKDAYPKPRAERKPGDFKVSRKDWNDIKNLSEQSGVPPNVLLGLARRESFLGHTKVQPGGYGRGLLHIDIGPNAHPDITEEQAMDNEFNLWWGINSLKNRMGLAPVVEGQPNPNIIYPQTGKYYTFEEAIKAHNVGGHPYSDQPTTWAGYNGAPIREVADMYYGYVKPYITDYDWEVYDE